MKFDLPAKVGIPADVLSQEVHGETVLLDLTNEQYFGLDRIGTRIWQLLGEGRPVSEVISLMLEEFDVTEEKLRADMSELLESLREAGLVTFENP